MRKLQRDSVVEMA